MIKDFDEIYEEVRKSSKDELDEVIKKLWKINIVIVIFIVIFIILFSQEDSSIIQFGIIMGVIIEFTAFVFSRAFYSKQFKKIVISKLINAYNKKLHFDEKLGIQALDYKYSELNEKFDKFESEDMIYGLILDKYNLKTSEVATYRIEEKVDSNGNKIKTDYPLFRGLFGVVDLNIDTSLDFLIRPDDRTLKFSNSRIEVDSSEFEKYFDLISNDKVRAMEVFTSDVIEKFINLKLLNEKYNFELKVFDRKLYFKYRCGSLFEAPKIKSGLSKEFLRKYYQMVFYPISAVEEIIKSIENLIKIEN